MGGFTLPSKIVPVNVLLHLHVAVNETTIKIGSSYLWSAQ